LKPVFGKIDPQRYTFKQIHFHLSASLSGTNVTNRVSLFAFSRIHTVIT
jgi:hypothetical protein